MISCDTQKMPANLLPDIGGGNSGPPGSLEQRAQQIALELSMLNFNGADDMPNEPLGGPHLSYEETQRLKKSANMTECVPVPSSEHVAEIVGRQGCKIKALRAKTNTYIKTPVRGEEPVFVVTGRKEDVCLAKREILSAAEHFSQIRASRRNNNACGLSMGPPSPNTPGQMTIQVRVPYRVVGLVVGPKGATIKRIQQQTHTYIVTPSRDKEPVFEVTGSQESVEKAKQEIESHIAMRTGGLVDNPPSDSVLDNGGDFFSSTGGNSGVDGNIFRPPNDVSPHHGGDVSVASLYKPPSSNSAFNAYSSNGPDNNIFNFSGVASGNGKLTNGDFSALTRLTSALGGLYDSDEGIDPGTALPASMWPDLTSSGSFAPTRPTQARLSPSPLDSASSVGDANGLRRAALPAFNSSSASSSPTDSSGSGVGATRRSCMLCSEGDVVAALVPCGHNVFCMDCAMRLVNGEDGDSSRCPICSAAPTQAIRIFS